MTQSNIATWVPKMPTNGRVLAGLAGLTVLAAGSVPARGVLMLTLSEPGFQPLTVTDTTNSGTVQAIGGYGTFATEIEVGLSNRTKPGTGQSAQLQIQSLDLTDTSTTAGSRKLTISLTDDGFTFPGSPGSPLLLSDNLSGTLTYGAVGDTVAFQSTATPAGSAATSTALRTFTATTANGPVPVLASVPGAQAPLTATTSFTLANTINVSLTNPGETTNLSGTSTVTAAAVPEPASLSLLALGGIALVGRRRR